MFAKLPMLLTMLSCCCFYGAGAQANLDDSSSNLSSENIVQNYTNIRDRNLLLYNGIEYARSYPSTTGYPFFLTDTFQRSSLVYDGVLYTNVPLAYDLVSNRVVIKNKDSFLLELVPEKVNSFLFKNHFFVSLTSAMVKSKTLQPGIYEVYDYSPIKILIRRQKVVQRATNAADLDHFTEFDVFFINNGNDYLSVKSSDELLSAFGDRSNEIKSFMRSNRLSFKKNPENALLKAAAYYVQLKK